MDRPDLSPPSPPGVPLRRLVLAGFSLSLAIPMSGRAEENRRPEPEETQAADTQEEADQEQTGRPTHAETVVVTATRGEEALVDSIALVTAVDSEETVRALDPDLAFLATLPDLAVTVTSRASTRTRTTPPRADAW